MKKKLLIFVLLLSGLFVLTGSVVYAQSVAGETADLLKSAGEGQGANFGTPEDPRAVAAYAIQILLGALGILFVAYLVYSGYMLLTSGGNEEMVTKAKRNLLYSIIGVLLILSAYSLSAFIGGYLGYLTSTGPEDLENDGFTITISPDVDGQDRCLDDPLSCEWGNN